LPLESSFADGEIEVVVTRLDETSESVAALARSLCAQERQRAARLRFERDRRRFIVARARLRELLAARLGVRPASVRLACNPNGKPALARQPAQAHWRFNVSHCEEVAVYALSRRREVGIDVEAIRSLPAADAIAAQCFTPRESEAYRGLAPRDKPLAFFRCWTRKEAFVKALGVGLSVRLDELDVSEGRVGENGAWRLESFSPLAGFIAALASRPG
jgi:4'-phosphopantetheinyl transferase